MHSPWCVDAEGVGRRRGEDVSGTDDEDAAPLGYAASLAAEPGGGYLPRRNGVLSRYLSGAGGLSPPMVGFGGVDVPASYNHAGGIRL